MKNNSKRKFLAAVVSAAVMAAMSTAAFAEEQPKGHIVFAADKNVLGQGFVIEPVSIPYYDGETGIEIIDRAADILVTDSEYGAYISAFADTDTGEPLPAEIAEVCPEMFGRTNDGYLSNFDYTAESGWNFFINDESSMVGISAYEPNDGDVVWFRFSVYGFGCDLGVDNSSWGGSAALVPSVKASSLMTALADGSIAAGSEEYSRAISTLETYGVTQAEIDSVSVLSDNADSAPIADKSSPETGIEGIAAIVAIAALSGAALAAAKKR